MAICKAIQDIGDSNPYSDSHWFIRCAGKCDHISLGLQAGLSLLVTISIILLAIIDADKIIVLEKGRVVEQGTHETVYDKNGAYKKIFDAMAHSLNIEKIARTLND